MSEKPNEPRTKIEDLPENTDALSAEELENVAGGLLRSPAAGSASKAVKGGVFATSPVTLTSQGEADLTRASDDS